METRDDPIDLSIAENQANGAIKLAGARTSLRSKAELERKRQINDAHRAYGRGRRIDLKSVKDKKLRRNLKNLENKYQAAALKAKDAEVLLEPTGFLEPETELEKTYKARQDDIGHDVAIETSQKRFELKLDQLGPYMAEYTRNGRFLALAGRHGHVATM